MSLVAQQQAMFDLLFNQELRQRFVRDRQAALQAYELTPDEVQDFHAIRLDALEFDASLRCTILLAAMAKALPITFCGLSSFERGAERLRAVLDAAQVQMAPADRPAQFAERLRQSWSAWPFADSRESALMQAILDAEWGMASTLAARRKMAVADLPRELPISPLPDDWLLQPLGLAPFVSAGVLPQPWHQLTQAWGAHDSANLWRTLQKTALPAAQRKAQFDLPQPRLFLARAVVSIPSACDPVIEHRTMELPEGFAALFQYVNGEYSVQKMLSGLQQAGSTAGILVSVQTGFRQLIENGMLVVGRDGNSPPGGHQGAPVD